MAPHPPTDRKRILWMAPHAPSTARDANRAAPYLSHDAIRTEPTTATAKPFA
jgi:hypothetical protein